MKRIRLIFSLFSGIAAALTAWLYIGGVENKYKKDFEKAPVVTAKRYIGQNEMIESKDVEIRGIPAEYLQPGHIKNIADLLSPDGDTPCYMASAPILKGEQVLGTKMIKLGLETGIAAIIPTGKRAITISYHGMAVRGIVSPGNRVDLVAVADEQSQTVLQNAQVLGVGRKIGALAGKRVEQDEIEESIPVTLAVSPQEAQVIALFSEKGRIYIALRPLGDKTTGSIQPASAGFSKSNKAAENFTDSARKKYDELLGVWKRNGIK